MRNDAERSSLKYRMLIIPKRRIILQRPLLYLINAFPSQICGKTAMITLLERSKAGALGVASPITLRWMISPKRNSLLNGTSSMTRLSS